MYEKYTIKPGIPNRLYHKILLIMRLTTVILLASLMQVSAVTFAQRITIEQRKAALTDVLREIGRQSKMGFLYDGKLINKRVDISVANATLEDALNSALAGTGLVYAIDGMIVTIKRKEETIGILANIVKGKVTNSKGEPLVDVNVTVKGTTTSTSTDGKGGYSIDIPKNGTLVFSYIGFVTQEIIVNNQTSINVNLQEETTGLNDVVVVGYGTQKKTNLTGAVAQVSGKVLDNRAMTNIGQGLQGQIGNLNITTNPGDPGGVGQGSSYNIRGNTSINGGSPLILIDGVSSDINYVNPNDIESITVLKDAASSAIYGARAAYGVILITTKQGSNLKTVVSYSGSVTSNSRTNYPKTVNSLTYATVMNEAASNAGSPNIFSAEQIERIKNYIADPQHTPTTVPDPTDPSKWSYGLGNDNVNYFKLFYKDGVLSQKHDLALSGGAGTTTYRVSLGYLDQDGIFRFGGDNYNQFNVLANLKTSPKKWLRFDFQTLYSLANDNQPYSYADNTGNLFHTTYTRQPHWAVYDPNGHPMWTSQIQFFEGARSISKENELWLKGGVEIEPIAGWKINARYAYGNSGVINRQHAAKLNAYDVNNNPYEIFSNNAVSESNGTNTYNSLELFTSYNKQLGDHSMSLLLGGQMEENNFFRVSGSTQALVSDQTPSLNTGTGLKDNLDAITHWANIGTFMRFNYNYKEKYLFEVNGRYDGTSKFPVDKQWGFFPSVSAGYNIAKEEFFGLKNQISELKLRASYGSLGNQQVANYMFYNTVPINSQLYWLINGQRPNYIRVPGLVSSDLTWETSRNLDLGLDISALRNRLSFSFDWYKRSTLNMIGTSLILPATLGTNAPRTNNADMVTQGFELSLGWKDVIGADFQYNVSFNLSDYSSKITKYNNPNQILSDYYKGQVLGDIWGYKTNGLIQTSEQLAGMADQRKYINANPWQLGDVEYKDLNGDKVISPGNYTLTDHGDLTIIGNNTPRYQFGINTGFVYKRISFNMFWQGVLKRDYWLSDIPFFGITGSWTQQIYNTTLDYWSPNNTNAYFAKPYSTGETQKNQLTSSRYLQNAAYLRLKNLQIGYTLPERTLSKLKISKVMVFLSGENLLFISKIDKNFDPEVLGGGWGNGKTYPLLKRITGGVKVEF